MPFLVIIATDILFLLYFPQLHKSHVPKLCYRLKVLKPELDLLLQYIENKVPS